MSGIFFSHNIKNISKQKFESSFRKFSYPFSYLNVGLKYTIGKVSILDEKKIYKKNNIAISFTGNFFTNTSIDKIPEEHVYDLYVSNSLEKLYNVNGQFIFVIYDLNQNKVLLMNDRFGHYRTFLSLNKESKTLLISPRIKPIVKLSEYNFKIDKESVYELFQFGYILNEKTPIKGISQIPPHSLIEINLDNLKIYKKRYYSFSYRSENKDSLDKKLTIFDKLWKKSISRKTKDIENLCIPISGGMDSRAILGTSMSIFSDDNLSCFTFGKKGTYDYEIPKKILKKYKIQHELVEAHKDNFEEEFFQSFYDTEGMIDSTPYFPATKYSQINLTNLYTGMMIDVFFGRHVLSRDFKMNIFRKNFKSSFNSTIDNIEDFEEIKNKIFGVNSSNNTSLIQKLFRNTDSYYSDGFKQTHPNLEEVNGKRYPDYFAEWDFYNRQYKYIPYMVKKFETRFNYLTMLDYELVDFSLGLSTEDRLDQIFYRKAFKKMFPKLFSFPIKSNNNLNIVPNRMLFYIKRNIERIKTVSNKFCKKFFSREIFQDKYLNYHNYSHLVKVNKDYNAFVSKYIEKAKVRKIYNNDLLNELVIHNSNLIGPIITVEMIFDYYGVL